MIGNKLLWILFVIYVLVFAFVILSCLLLIALWTPAGKRLTSCLSCVFDTFPCGVSGQVWYLIVSIPDFCLLPYFYIIIFILDPILRSDSAVVGSLFAFASIVCVEACGWCLMCDLIICVLSSLTIISLMKIRAGCFTLIVSLLSCVCLCSVSASENPGLVCDH